MKPLNIIEVVNVRWWNACAHYGVLLSEGLQKLGHKVYVAGDPDSRPIRMAKEKGLDIIDKYTFSKNNPTNMLRITRGIRKFIEEKNIDLINLHRGQAAIAFSVAARTAHRNCKIVRTWGDQRKPKKNLFARLQNSRFTDYIITTTRKMEDYFLEYISIDPAMISTIHGGIDESIFVETNDKNVNRGEEVIKIGMLGRFSPVKGHFNLIEAFKKVASNRNDVKLYIAGKAIRDEKKDQLLHYVDHLGLNDRVEILGYIEDKIQFMSSLDLCVVPSVDSETISRVLFEFMAMGKPVVGYRLNAIAEIIEENFNGYLAETGNTDDLADKILLAIGDKNELTRMGNNSRFLIDNKYSLLKFAKDTEDIYLKIIERG
ncbi:glycosyltransferase family 4 protein [bacterium]|nr:glycosyltransferase family 4 protein [bacterium]